MPVSGAKTVKDNMKRIFKDISEKKAPQFVNAVISIRVSITLLNCRFTDVY